MTAIHFLAQHRKSIFWTKIWTELLTCNHISYRLFPLVHQIATWYLLNRSLHVCKNCFRCLPKHLLLLIVLEHDYKMSLLQKIPVLLVLSRSMLVYINDTIISHFPVIHWTQNLQGNSQRIVTHCGLCCMTRLFPHKVNVCHFFLICFKHSYKLEYYKWTERNRTHLMVPLVLCLLLSST